MKMHLMSHSVITLTVGGNLLRVNLQLNASQMQHIVAMLIMSKELPYECFPAQQDGHVEMQEI